MSSEEAPVLPTPAHSPEVYNETNPDYALGRSGEEARGQPSGGHPTILFKGACLNKVKSLVSTFFPS